MSKDTNIIKVTENDIDLPLVKILTGRGFITGKSGSGKSNTAGKICEEILDKGYPLMVIDIEGEYYGLKEEYELLHVGADEECDLQVGAEHAHKLAELALEQNVPIILDVSGYVNKDEVNQLVHNTCKKIFDKNKKMKIPFPILVEEAHEWMPQTGSRGEDGRVTDMLLRISARGRKRGLGICALSQRPAKVDKDHVTQADYKIWHKQDWDSDLKTVGKVLGRDYVDDVKTLDVGSAFLQTDFLEPSKQKVQFLKKKTFDAGATPDLEDFERPELKSVSSDLVEELQDISEKKKQEQNRVQQLEEKLEERDERIEELEDENENLRQNNETVDKLADKLAQAASGGEEGGKALDEIREEKDSKIRDLEKEKDQLEEELEEVKSERLELQERVEELEEHEQAVEHMDELKEGVTRMAEALGLDTQGNDAKVRKMIEQKQEKIQELEAKISKLQQQGYSLDEEFEEKMDFLKHEAVKKEIDKASDKTSLSEDHAWDALSVLVDQEEAKIEEIVPYVDVNKSNISRIMARLAEHGVVTKGKQGQKNLYSLNTEGMKDIVQTQKKRSEMNELKEQVKAAK